MIRAKLKELRAALKAAQTEAERWALKRRISELTPMLTQTNKVADLLEHYYERGYWRSASYSVNSLADRQRRGQAKKAAAACYRDERADGGPAGYVSGLLCQRPHDPGNCQKKKSQQEHRMQNSQTRRGQSDEVHQVPVSQDIDAIVEAFLHPKEQQNPNRF